MSGRRWKRASHEEIREAVAAYAASGLSQREFALVLGVSLSTLARWLRRVESARDEAAAAQPSFIAVDLAVEPDPDPVPSTGAMSGAAFEVRLGARVVRVTSGFDASELVRLVRTLEAC